MYDIPALDLPTLAEASGTVRLPGSKSISNRVLLLAGLCAGDTVLSDVLSSDDTRVMLDALRALGCVIHADGPSHLRITGLGGVPRVSQAQLFLGNAGTAMRPLSAALAVLTCLHGGEYEVSGVPRMHERPIADLVDALRGLGCEVDDLGTPGFPPLRFRGGHLNLRAPVRVRGDVSSQFLTALLMALPLASGNQAVDIEVLGPLISRPYIDITLALLHRFGVRVEQPSPQHFRIPQGSVYRSPGALAVEGDASGASYFIGLGAIAAHRDALRIEGVGPGSIQGDIAFADAARAMGAQVVGEGNALVVRRGAWPLHAIDLDCNHIPDAAMTLAVMALYADGPSTLRNIASWRVKETDRLHAMATELRKLGATVAEGPDWLRVHPLRPGQWRDAAIHTYDDHRVAMCFSLAAANPDQRVVRILDPRCVAKTYPDYFEAFFSVGRSDSPQVPVICVDGPTASGKGTLAAALAQRLGWQHLDSGSLYRAVAWLAVEGGLALDDEVALADLARQLPIAFRDGEVWLKGQAVGDALRAEEVGVAASKISSLPTVRTALVARQLAFRSAPGVVADGRDMGTVIFPDAPLKVFLTATAEARAERRYKQLISKGFSPILDGLRADIAARDERDANRAVSPLKPAADALLLDNSALSIADSVEQVLRWWQQRRPAGLNASQAPA
jgi:3-phosphoshikimate 1-carboxyvinyltransferase